MSLPTTTSAATVAALLLALTGCGSNDASAARPPGPIGARCSAESGTPEGFVQDRGNTLVMDSLTLSGVGDPKFDALRCVLDALNTSDATRSLIASTTPEMGRQSRTENGYVLTWSLTPGGQYTSTTMSMLVELDD